MDTYRDKKMVASRKISNASKSSKLSFEEILEHNPPEAVHFVQIATDIFSLEFPDIWKLGQAYFQGDLIVKPDPDKSSVFKVRIF